jgi:hypothetical protein
MIFLIKNGQNTEGPLFEKKQNIFVKKEKAIGSEPIAFFFFLEIKYLIIYLISTNHGFHLIIRQPQVAVAAVELVQLS